MSTSLRNWLIVIVVLAGGVYFWPGGKESPEPQPGKPTAGRQLPPMDRVKEEGTPDWPQYGTPYGVFRPMQESTPGAPRPGSYRPRDNQPEPRTGWQPSYRYPTAPTDPSYGDTPTFPGYQSPSSPYQQWQSGTPGYRFRPRDSREQSKRWTGNYPLPPGQYPSR